MEARAKVRKDKLISSLSRYQFFNRSVANGPTSAANFVTEIIASKLL